MSEQAKALVAKWREPTPQDDCTLYTMGQRAGRTACADELESALSAPAQVGKAVAVRERVLADRERALLEYVADYEMVGEDESGREGAYQPNERERFLIEDAIRGWDALHDTTPPAPSASHPDDEAVDRFAAAMKAKLAEARAKGRGGWDGEEDLQQRLSDMLRDHVAKGDPRDVANFACFLWNRGESILEPAPNAADAHWNAAGEELDAAGDRGLNPPSAADAVELDRYDAGLLGDGGGGNVEWWQDYLRAELDRAHDFYQSQIPTPTEDKGGAWPDDAMAAIERAQTSAMVDNDKSPSSYKEGIIKGMDEALRIFRRRAALAAAAPQGDGWDAYHGAREDLQDWKGRAQRAESRLRSLGWQGVDASEAPQDGGEWVLAPKVPTLPMWESAENAMIDALVAYENGDKATFDDCHSWPTQRIWQAVVAYRAMLAAAPPALTQSVGGRYFASGPEGCFWADDLDFAEAIIRKSNHSDDWTVIDLTQPAPSSGEKE